MSQPFPKQMKKSRNGYKKDGARRKKGCSNSMPIEKFSVQLQDKHGSAQSSCGTMNQESSNTSAVQNGCTDGECLNVWVFLWKQFFYTGSTALVLFLCMQHWLFMLYIFCCLLATVYLTHFSDGMDFSAMRLLKREIGAYV